MSVGHLYVLFGEMFIYIFCSFFEWAWNLCNIANKLHLNKKSKKEHQYIIRE